MADVEAILDPYRDGSRVLKQREREIVLCFEWSD